MKHSKIFRINASEVVKFTLTLDDDSKNGYDTFFTSVSNYHLKGNSGEEKLVFEGKVYKMISCGIGENDIEKIWPEILPFFKMQGCDMFGVNSYPILNGMFNFEKDLDKGRDFLRLTNAEALKLVDFKQLSFCNFLLKELVQGRYVAEVKAAIEVLEGLTGVKYNRTDKVSPYLYNDMHYSFVTDKKGWNVYKGLKEKPLEYSI